MEGSIVTLEPLALTHHDGLWTAAQDPLIWTWTTTDTYRPEIFERWFTSRIDEARAGILATFAVIEAATNQVIGHTGYDSFAPEHRRLEVGHTWYVRRVWGTGVNVECKLLLFTHAFENLRCQRVELKTNALNERSRAAIAGVGGQFEGIFRKHMVVKDGQVRDSAYFSIIDDDWPAVKRRLRLRLEQAGKELSSAPSVPPD